MKTYARREAERQARQAGALTSPLMLVGWHFLSALSAFFICLRELLSCRRRRLLNILAHRARTADDDDAELSSL